jgi:hypothetical protein
MRIFVMKDQCFSNTDISHHCKEQDLGICIIQMETKAANLVMLSLCRAPSGGLNEFLKRLGAALKYLYTKKSEFLVYYPLSSYFIKLELIYADVLFVWCH